MGRVAFLPCILLTIVAMTMVAPAHSTTLAPDLRTSAAVGTTCVRAHFPSWTDLHDFLAEHAGTVALSERLILRPDLLVDDDGLRALSARGVPYEVMASPRPFAAADGLRGTNYGMRRLRTEIEAAAADHSRIVRHEIIGRTHEERDLHAVKISDHPDLDEDEPAILFVGVHHAQETIGVDCLMMLLHTLIDGYGNDPALTALVDDTEIWLVPMLNPDGWSKIEDGELFYWRKNCCDNNRNRTFDEHGDGVDLNRNYGCNWGQVGSHDPTDADYYGPAAFSEPEVQALRTLILDVRPSLAMTYHMAGEFLIMPWACADGPPPDAVAYRAIGEALATSIVRDEGSGHYELFEGGTSGGFMDDWVYVETGGFSYTLEVSTENYPAAIDRVARNHLVAALYALDRLHGPQITGTVTDVHTHRPVRARVELREIRDHGVRPRLSDTTFGRHRRLVEPGAYTLVVTADGYEPIERPDITVGAGGPAVVDVSMVPRPQVTLAPPSPNPVRGTTTLRYYVPRRGAVRLDVYAASGRHMRQLSGRVHTIGWWEIDWDGRDQSGHAVPGGIYFARLRHGDTSSSRRVVVVR